MTSTWEQHITPDILAVEQRQIGKLVASGTMTPEQAKVEARGWFKDQGAAGRDRREHPITHG